MKNINYRPHQQIDIQSDLKTEMHMEILSRFAMFIANGNNPITKMQALWILANEKEKKEAAALIERSHENMLKQVEGYIRYPGFGDYRYAYEVCTSKEGREWMEEALDEVKKLANKDRLISF